ncbi:MAG: META domain-containing protein [Maritimibacter sp.]|nr:META domain-containing protein [Maritimibacter sp.]
MKIAPLVLTFAALAAPALAQSTGATGWTLVSVAGSAVAPGATIAFSADGAVFGTTGCNRFNGTVVAAPGVVTFNAPLAVTRIACDDTLMAQEKSVLEALAGTAAVAYDPVADRMTLIPDSGAPVLGFARAEQ